MTDPNGGFAHVELDDPRVMWVDPQWLADHTNPGDPHTWREELALLWRVDLPRLTALIADINSRGIKFPVRLEPADEDHQYRVLDGHHRIAAGMALRIDVPVVVEVLVSGTDAGEPL